MDYGISPCQPSHILFHEQFLVSGASLVIAVSVVRIFIDDSALLVELRRRRLESHKKAHEPCILVEIQAVVAQQEVECANDPSARNVSCGVDEGRTLQFPVAAPQ